MRSKLQNLAHEGRNSNTCPGCIAAFCPQHALPLKAVEVLSKAPTICEEVMPFNDEHKQSIYLVEGVEDA